MIAPLDEDEANRQLDKISRFADKNQRLSFKRKGERMQKLLDRISPIEKQILELILEKNPIMDEIDKVRRGMVHECVHPRDHLAHKGTHVQCKFCAKEIGLNE
jgi:hypothetical protein